MSLQAADLRSDFPLLNQSNAPIYLDSAATALKPKPVIDAINTYYSQESGTVHRAVYQLAQVASEKYSAVRDKAKAFLNAKRSDEVIFTKGTTDGINLIAATFPFKPGDEILISAMEHHSNIVPWQLIAKKTGAAVKMIPVTPEGDLDLAAFQTLLSPKTKLVSIAHMTNVTGTIYPVEKVIELAHAAKAKVFLDGAQAAPHLNIDVQKLDVDFYAFSGHKLYGPTGIGILYGKYELLDGLQPYQGGSDMIDQVSFDGSTFQKPPLKFEAGTPSIANVMGLGAAFDYVKNHCIDESELTSFAITELSKIPNLRILGEPKSRGPLVSFVIDGAHPLDVGTLLGLKGVYVRTGHLCSQPTMQHFGITQAIRMSFGLYNTAEDVLQSCQILKSILSNF